MKKLGQLNIDQAENEVLEFWNKQEIFQKSLDQTKSGKAFSFYDGPPFANGLPHFGHSLVTAIKDAVGRYKTMNGYYVERRNGWDCHGLPVEYEIEKIFNVSGKKQILELGLDTFNKACRESVFTYKKDWEAFFERIGRWTDTEHSYATMDTDYIESVWWVLAQVHKKNLLYRGYKSMPYCPRCETPLSNFELNEGYRDGVQDPSLYVKFKLTNQDAYLLAWTTTPWSLFGNAALALKPKATYVRVRVSDDAGKTEELILAQSRLTVLDSEYEILEKIPAAKLAGLSYEPLFMLPSLPESDNLYKVWLADFVSIDDGTGVLHVAPAFGEDDLTLAQTNEIPVLTTIEPDGTISPNVGNKNLVGVFFKEADKQVIELLTESDRVFSAEEMSHIYPFCYRCESPLLYYAISTWFVRVSQMRDKLLTSASGIDWVPEHVKAGRFGKWLEGARDWAISRNRYWGSPLPIWVNDEDETDYLVIESLTQLRELVGSDVNLDDLHRPAIDEVVITHQGKTYHRVTEVLDCWFESGSMPYAQKHYPFENEQIFHETFPADYIGEGLDQTRLWFYVLHVLSTALFEKPAYKNVIVNGMIMAADGQKLSKRLKNYPPLADVFSNEGADSLRYYLLSSPATVGEYMRFSRDGLKDITRNIFMTLYNSASFLTLYGEIDNWQPPKTLSIPKDLKHPLDIWLVERIAQVSSEVTAGAEQFDLGKATRPLEGLIDDLSNWYVRRSRRRFWKSDNDSDKSAAYETLYYALVTTTQLMAPWAPFMSDYIYRALTIGTNMPQSVHLTTWPKLAHYDEKVLFQMADVRSIISEGLAARAHAGIKVRQPLAQAELTMSHDLADDLIEIIQEELNVKEVIQKKGNESSVRIDTSITDTLKAEGMARDLIRAIQATRKRCDFNVEDRITVQLSGSKALQKALTSNEQMVKTEVLAQSIEFVDEVKDPHNSQKIEGDLVYLYLTKV